jgi:dethiobiotin synthetase
MTLTIVVTGTDTGIGKTVFAPGLTHAAADKAYFNGKGHCTAWPIQTRQAEPRRSPWLDYDR